MVEINDVGLLAKRVSDAAYHQKRWVVALGGVPGSGKSTISAQVVDALRQTYGIKAVVLPQDGYHYYRAELAQFKDPEQAFARRGAPFTFNAKAFVDTVKRIRTENGTILAPSFDHRLKDPVENDIVIAADCQVVFIEGNYVLLTEEPWGELRQLVDDSWFVTGVDLEIRARLIKRHLEAGICADEKEAAERADGSDMLNARYIVDHLYEAEVVVPN